MPIKHIFQSGKTDGGDNTLVRPSNWNDNHTGSPDFLQTSVANVSGNYTVASGDYAIFVTAVGASGAATGNLTILLPDSKTNKGRLVVVKKVDQSLGAVIIDSVTATDGIEGRGNYILGNYLQYAKWCSDGKGNWYIVSSN